MTKKQRIENLKEAIFSDDWEAAKAASNRLFNFGGRFSKNARRKNRQFLLTVLDQDASQARRVVALTFQNHRFQPAVRPLLRAIQKPANSWHRGTMVYALEKLDCSRHLGELFHILFGAIKNWEVQAGILTVLDEQAFIFDRTGLHTIAAEWEAIKEHWNELNGIAETKPGEGPVFSHDRVLIQDFVDAYLAYLS